MTKHAASACSVQRRIHLVWVAVTIAAACVTMPQTALAQDPLMAPRYLELGLQHRRRAEFDESLRHLRLAIAADSTYARAWFELGYLFNEMGRRADAVQAFVGGLRQEPRNITGLRQLGYWYGEAGRLREGIAAFDSAFALGSDNPYDRLETGFLNQRLGDREEALRSFVTAQASPDTSIARRARQSIEGMTAQLAPNAATSATPTPTTTVARSQGWIRPVFMDIYATPLYQTRFSNAIVQLVTRAGVVAENRTRFSPYLSLRVTRDSRSRGGSQPVIFSDNIAIPAFGARFQPLKPWSIDNVYLYAEAGTAIELVNAGQARRARSDVRAGGFYIGQWRAGSPSPSDHTPLLLISDVYADAGYFSRFTNTIGFAQFRESLRLYEFGGRAVDLFAKASIVGDTDGVYYNNAREVSGGIALYPESKRQVVILLERLQGRYLRAPDAGSARTYNDARVTVILSAYRWIEARSR